MIQQYPSRLSVFPSSVLSVAQGKKSTLSGGYSNKVLGYSPIAYWPLWETAGTQVEDISGNNCHGTYIDITLGHPGIGDGNTCPLFDGVDGYISALSSEINSVFNGSEGAFLIWAKIFNAGVWVDGLNHWLLELDAVDGIVRFHEASGSNQIWWRYTAGGVSKFATRAMTTTDWFIMGQTWSKSSDEVIRYYNGSFKNKNIGLGVWSGDLIALRMGAHNDYGSGPIYPWYGWLAHAMAFDYPLSPAEIEDISIVD